MAHQEIVWSPALPALHAGVLCDVRKWDGSTGGTCNDTVLPTAIPVSCYLCRVSLVFYKTQFAATCRFKHQDKQATAFSEIYHTFMCILRVYVCVWMWRQRCTQNTLRSIGWEINAHRLLAVDTFSWMLWRCGPLWCLHSLVPSM